MVARVVKRPRRRRSTNFNLSIQRQLSSSTVIEIAYNGVVGTHLQSQLLEINQVDPDTSLLSELLPRAPRS